MGDSKTQSESAEPSVCLAAVGDILLADDPTGRSRRDAHALFARAKTLWADADVLVGNLECTLEGTGNRVPTEPRVVAAGQTVRSLAAGGFHAFSLANNHVFDCGWEGFAALRSLLEGMEIAWFGAGANLAEARRPAILERNGLRIALVGFADRRSGTSRFATYGSWGVNPLDHDAICAQVRELGKRVDHVLLCPHWGEERLNVPSPEQVAQARAWIDAGATAVLGHHPHVLQGLEFRQGRPIAYSLGNFVANPVRFCDGDVMHWNRVERTGCVLRATLTGDGVKAAETLPTFDDGFAVAPDPTARGRRRLAKTSKALAKGVTVRRYRREYFRVKTLIPILQHLRPSRLIRLRPRHFVNAARLLLRGRKAR